MSGSHGHDHTPDSALLVALAGTIVVLAIEAAAGVYANSLALLSDAGHMLTDVGGLGLTWLTLRRSNQPATSRYTFGYRRSGILAALANALLLMAIAVVIGFEAFVRLEHPGPVSGLPVVVAAAVALGLNGFIVLRLRPHRHESINVRAAALHVIGDMAASAAVVLAGITILVTHWYPVDPILSFGIAALIAVGGWRIVDETLGILMQGTPQGMDLRELTSAMMAIPGVEDVHDLHVWTLADGYRVLSAHIAVPDQRVSNSAALVADIRVLLKRRFGIEHATVELECSDRSPAPRPIRMETRT